MNEIDYKLLLTKYIQQVLDAEGTTFINEHMDFCIVPFTVQEVEELNRIDKNIL